MPPSRSPGRTIRIVVADDHRLVRDGLRRMLEQEPDFRVVGEAADGPEALEAVRNLSPDILLLDIAMPVLDGMSVLMRLASDCPDVRILLLTAAIDRAQTNEAVRLGARGIVMKAAAIEVLIRSIRAIMAGEYWFDRSTLVDVARHQDAEVVRFGLTARELELMSQLASGSSNKEIAELLGISEATVKRHLANIFDKVGVSSRLELAVFAMNHGLVQKL